MREGKATRTGCIIFDLDGTLVDSEGVCNRAFLDLLPELDDTVEGLVAKYRGRKLGLILQDLERRIGRPLPADFEPIYRARVAELFDQELAVMPGAREMLDALTVPVCVASNGPIAKMRHALRIAGLAPYFGENLFSAYELKVWKPDPGLFLHAAAAMGCDPAECVVVEDSALGAGAAVAAGMRTFHYLPFEGVERHPGAIPLARLTDLPGLLASEAAQAERPRISANR